MNSVILEVVIGALIAILLTIWVEYLRKPKLSLRIAPPVDMEYYGKPAKHARFVGIEVVNAPLPRIARWMMRNAALQCHGYITFHHLDGQNVFGRSMPIRWSSAPEPVPMILTVGYQQIVITDPARFTLSPRVDIYPGESEKLDVAAKFDDDNYCYGWSNENYFSTPPWRNPDWALPPGRYLVKVVIISAGEKVQGIFRLINDVGRQDFRIEPPLPQDRVYG
jgi:hypothetical protein